MSIDVQEAAEEAIKFALQLYGSDRVDDLRVEEFERSDDGEYWLITLGWIETATTRVPGSGLGAFTGGGGEIEKLPRTYKVFKVDVESGEVESMKMRDV